MPTHEEDPLFLDDYADLTDDEVRLFKAAIAKFVHDLDAGGPIRQGLRIHELHGQPGVFSVTWAPDGRATFSFGSERVPGKRHIIWRRVGKHAIYKQP